MTPKRRSALIAGAVALAVLLGGVLALNFWPEGEAENADPTPSQAELKDLISEKVENIQSITFTPQGGAPYTIAYDGTAYTLQAEHTYFPGKADMMSSVFYYAVTLTYLTPVAQDAAEEQMAVYGLDKPVMSWRVNRSDGTSVELMVGTESVTGSGRYARRKNGRDVYLLNSTQSYYVTVPASDIYDLSFIPFEPSTDDLPTWSYLVYCLLEKPDDIIEIKRHTDEEIENGPMGTSTYYLTQPHPGEGNDYTIERSVFVPATYIAPGEIIEANPADYSVYGLDAPVRLTLEAEDGWRGVLLIGSYDAEKGGRYVMLEGIDVVLLDKSCDYQFLSTDYSYLRTTSVWLYDIETVDSVSYDLQGVSRTLRFEHNLEEKTLRGWLDDVELTETNARRLYVYTLRIMQEGSTDAEVPSGKPDYTTTIHFSDGGSQKLELYRLNERQYLIVQNGENSGLVISRTSLRESFLNKFDILDAGGEIPRL